MFYCCFAYSNPSYESDLITLSLDLMFLGNVTTDNHLAVYTRVLPRLMQLRPLSGPLQGSTRLTLTGARFSAVSRCECVFIRASSLMLRTIARYLAHDTLTCNTPPLSNTAVSPNADMEGACIHIYTA